MIVNSPDSVPFRNAVNIDEFPVSVGHLLFEQLFKTPMYVQCLFYAALLVTLHNKNNSIDNP